MSSDPWAGPLFWQLCLLLLSMLLAFSFHSLSLLSDARLRTGEEDDDPTALKLLAVFPRRDRLCNGTQLCMLLVSFVSVTLLLRDLTAPLTNALQAISWLSAVQPAVLHGVACVILLLCYSMLLLILTELLPLHLLPPAPEKTALRLLIVAKTAALIVTPLVFLCEQIAMLLARMMGVDPEAEEEVTEEEIRAMVDISSESGAIEETEKEMIENIFEFNNRTAGNVMTHRIDVTAIWVGDDSDTIMETIMTSGRSRFPVYDEDIDDIIGILNTRDYLLNARKPQPEPLRHILREAFFVPETVQADSLFREMQKKNRHMAVVIDEYGGMSGIVTMEDLLEEIVGNIYDETDECEENEEIAQVSKDTYRMPGSATLKDISEELEIDLPEDEAYDTLGGLIFDQFTTIPEDGTTPVVDVAGLHIEVESIQDHRVESALVTRLPDAEEKPEEDKRKEPSPHE